MRNDATFKADQKSARKYLKYELARNKPSAASRLAQLMLTSGDQFDSSTEEIEEYEMTCTDRKKEESLPRCDRPQDWTEFSQWKHPELGLNLLQLAIVCGHLSGVKYLWQDCFKEKQKYLDASSRLVNHPWHLIFALGTEYEEELPIEEADVEVFISEGKVDLEADLLANWPITRNLVTGRAGILLAGSKVGLDWMLDDHYDTFSDAWWVLLEKMLSPQAKASTVEFMWKLIWHTPLNGVCLTAMSSLMAIMVINRVGKSRGQLRKRSVRIAEECVILTCQLWFRNIYKIELVTLCCILWQALKIRIPLTKAVGFLRPSDLWPTIRLMASDPEMTVESRRSLFRDFAAEIPDVPSLVQLCVHPILRAVNGDARKVWEMSELTEPVKTLFHRPFQDLHDQL